MFIQQAADSIEQESTFPSYVQQTINSTSRKVNTDSTVIDLLSITEFEDKHLKEVESLYGAVTSENPYGGWPKVFPELYGNKLPWPLKFNGWKILSNDLVDLLYQMYRSSGQTREEKRKAIHQNIERNGYKLKYPAVAWFNWGTQIPAHELHGKFHEVITGTTRGGITSGNPFNIPNSIVAEYVVDPTSGATSEQIADALEICGLSFNSIHDPAAPVEKSDVIRTVTKMIQRYQKTEGKAGIPNTMKAIEERVDISCGEGVFQPQTRQVIVYSIYNNFNPQDRVLSYSGSTGNKLLNDKRLLWKWADTDKVKYIYRSTEADRTSFIEAIRKSAQYPKAEIRVVLHTGTLPSSIGYNHKKLFEKAIGRFIEKFNNYIEYSCKAFIGESVPLRNKIKIYAAYPALGTHHDLDTPFMIDEKTETAYQKTRKKLDGVRFNYAINGAAMLPFDEDEDE